MYDCPIKAQNRAYFLIKSITVFSLKGPNEYLRPLFPRKWSLFHILSECKSTTSCTRATFRQTRLGAWGSPTTLRADTRWTRRIVWKICQGYPRGSTEEQLQEFVVGEEVDSTGWYSWKEGSFLPYICHYKATSYILYTSNFSPSSSSI